jgi:pimeloyl-ACP methyl ester carboxylesterase
MTGKEIAATPKPRGGRRARVEGVAVMHGLGRTRAAMELLARRLRRAGFEAVCIAYPSRRLGVAEAAEVVAARIADVARGWDVVHLVGHSMGGVIAATVAASHPEIPVGRVVTIGAPMRGSGLARRLSGVAPFDAALGPALADFARPKGPLPPSPRIGAIAGTAGIRIFGRGIGLAGINDGKVSLRSAWAGAGHRAAVPVGHAMLPVSRQVAELTIAFLRDGRFPAEAERAA